MPQQETRLRLQVRRMEGRDSPKKLVEQRGDFLITAEGDSVQAWTKKEVFENLHKFENFLRGEK